MISVLVGIHGLAGDHNRAGGVRHDLQKRTSIVGSVRDAVDDQIGTRAENCCERTGVGAVGGMKSGAAGGEIGGHPARIAAGDVDLPSGAEQTAGGSPADQAGSANDQSPRHM